MLLLLLNLQLLGVLIRGNENPQQSIFSHISTEESITEDHPLRPIRKMVDSAPEDMSDQFSIV